MKIFTLALCTFIFCAALPAQSDRGTITGTVIDQGGAVVPNAAIAIRNSESGATFQTITTGTGNYTLASLPAGPYEITVELPGFKRYTQRGILVQVAQTERIDIKLEVGAASESVTVMAEAPLLKTEDAEQSHTMTGVQIGNLPINFSVLSGGYVRSPFAFITNEPGANNTGQNVIRVNGMPNSSQSMMFEGQEATNSLSAARIDELQPSVEAIEAAALQTSNFAPEFGQIIGGLFNFNAKSGTNQIHGSLYEYLANDTLNAGIPFTNSGNGHLIRPSVRRNDFGFSVGGPVDIPKLYNGRNRTFFFFAWEFYKQAQTISGVYQTVPTLAMRNGDFSQILTGKNLGSDALGRTISENTIYDPASAATVNGQVITNPFPNNVIPMNRISPVTAKIQQFLPAPSNGGLVNNWQQTYPTPKYQSVPSIKIDENLNTKQKISFYYSEFRTDQYVTPDGLSVPITALRILYERNRTMRLNYDYTVTSRLLIHTGAGYILYRNPDQALPGVLNYDAPGQLGLLGGVPNNFTGTTTAAGFPRLTGLTTASYGMGLNMGPANANKYAVDKPTLVLNAAYVVGNHSYKVGADWRIDAYRDRNVRGSQGIWNFSNNETAMPYLQSASVGGSAIGNAYASFLLGLADSASVQTPQDPQFRKTSWNLFIQDNWKITRRLTLSYGLRWDYQGGADEIHQRLAEFSATTPNPSAGGLPGATIFEGNGPGRCNCSFTNTYPYAVGPRLGVAYQVDSKTVFRAGWGLTYGTTSNFNYISNTAILGGGSLGYNQISFVSPGFGTPAATFGQGLPYTQAQLYPTTLSAGIVPFTGQLNSPPYWIDRNGGRPPRINQWNIGLQRQITTDLVVEAAYVGNRGAWLQANNLTDINGQTVQRLAAFGLNLNDPNARSLLTSTFASGKPQAAGFQVPYVGFPLTQTLAQALRPFPQFSNIPVLWSPRGDNWYDSMQAKATQRLKHGLNAQVSFTWQKELTDAENTGGNDIFNLPVQKAISGSSIPLELAISFNYRFPVLPMSNKIVRSAIRDWTLGGTLRYQSGLPILSPYATNNLNTLLPRLVGANITYANPTGQPFFTQGPNCHCFDPNGTFILNPAAWSQPAAGQWGVGAPYYNNYRWQRQPAENLSLGRTFRFRERMGFQIRAEFFNVFNRVFLSAPTATNAGATQVRTAGGQTVSGFGYINTSVTNIQTGGAIPTTRNGQIVARLTW
jgi:hypothetical protein